MIQTVLVIVAVLIAVGYLGWQVYRRFFGKETGCDGCSINKANELK